MAKKENLRNVLTVEGSTLPKSSAKNINDIISRDANLEDLHSFIAKFQRRVNDKGYPIVRLKEKYGFSNEDIQDFKKYGYFSENYAGFLRAEVWN